MLFEKCLYCPAIKERRCSGPNYMAMDAKSLVEWLTKYQRLNGITNTQLAERSGIPKGTIDGIKYRADIRHDTICHLIQTVIEMTGGKWGGEPCGDSVENNDRLRDTVKELQGQLTKAEDNAKTFKDLLSETQTTMKTFRIAIIGLVASIVLLLLIVALRF